MFISGLLVLLFVLTLFMPYDWEQTDDTRGLCGTWKSVLYVYTYRPGYEHVTFDGLRRIQLWLVLISTTLISQIQPKLINWLLETVQRTLGL